MRGSRPIAIALLLIVVSLAASGLSGASSQYMKVEHHRYNAAPVALLGIEGGCDEEAFGAVVFCETLRSGPRPDRFHVAIDDDQPLPVAGHWEFRSSEGVVLWEGDFCKEENDGPVPDEATRFVVRMDPRTDCGAQALQGWIIVAWRWGTHPEPTTAPPPPCCGCGCG